MTGSGLQATGEWVPQFPGQRPPFAPGNSLGLRHGAFSEKIIGPLAEALAEDLLSDEATPLWLHERSYRHAVMAWARAEAEVLRLAAKRDELDALAGDDAVFEDLTDVTIESVDEHRPVPGVLTRSGILKQRESIAKAIHRAESRAATRRSDLGLTPASRARLGRDITAAGQLDLAKLYALMSDEDRDTEDG